MYLNGKKKIPESWNKYIPTLEFLNKQEKEKKSANYSTKGSKKAKRDSPVPHKDGNIENSITTSKVDNLIKKKPIEITASLDKKNKTRKVTVSKK